MIEKFRLWLRAWIGLDAFQDNVHVVLLDHGAAVTKYFNNLQGQINNLISASGVQQTEIRELRAEVTRLSVAQYAPPQTPEPDKKKVIPTTTFKQFSDILEREQAEMEAKEYAS